MLVLTLTAAERFMIIVGIICIVLGLISLAFEDLKCEKLSGAFFRGMIGMFIVFLLSAGVVATEQPHHPQEFRTEEYTVRQEIAGTDTTYIITKKCR